MTENIISFIIAFILFLVFRPYIDTFATKVEKKILNYINSHSNK